MSRVLTLPENTKGRDFVVGDIHGAFDLLEKALAEAQFDPARDRLISVGDLINRGPQSPRCLEFLQQPWFFAISGNHEELFARLCSENGTFDIEPTKKSGRVGAEWTLQQTPEKLAEMRKAFAGLPMAIEVQTRRGTVGFVHAEVPKGMDWATFKNKLDSGDEEALASALWGRKRITENNNDAVEGVGRIYCGHTPQKTGPVRLGNHFFVDTGAVNRVLRGDEIGAQFFLTLCDITAKRKALLGPSKNNKNLKVVTKAPKRQDKPFKNYGLQ